MIINGLDCGDEFELSREEFAVLLMMVRERMQADAERDRKREARVMADEIPDSEIIMNSEYFIDGRLQHPFYSGYEISNFLQDARKRCARGESW